LRERKPSNARQVRVQDRTAHHPGTRESSDRAVLTRNAAGEKYRKRTKTGILCFARNGLRENDTGSPPRGRPYSAVIARVGPAFRRSACGATFFSVIMSLPL
jgi:hypothetical protein